ncbi:MAG: AAA family ATPase, partial [Gammaproteobacteria bacterium]|nr:AAA family ATPase [Gammaproteobacteria bacterium]
MATDRTRGKLPIGIQNFRRLRERGCYYVDKTPLIRALVDQGDYYFLSRPRRFGKSLLVDTLQELFAGSEELFRGLDIHGHWDWSGSHPVVRLSFDGKYNQPEDVEHSVLNQLALIEHGAGIDPARTADGGPERLQNLLYHLHHSTGRAVVVLVDEYDKPILDVLDDPDLARANRDWLRGFYGIIKGSARHVRFVLVTGVSRFSKVSLFSGLNNLEDISLDPTFATICGYTDNDLDTVFAPELPGLDREEIRRWYNGYHWRGGEK